MRAIYLGDAVIDELNFEHPDWVSVVDSIASMAVTNRRALIEKAIRENRLLVAFRLAARGHAERADGNYRFHLGPDSQ